MSRINTNISSLQAMHRLHKNNQDLATRMTRLSTGLKINSGKDAPAGLIASEALRSEIAGTTQAITNTQRANNVINTAEGALSEVSALMLEVQTLTNEAANNGALSPEEIKANQLQVDAILNSINRISNTTQFNGVKLLNGSLDYSTSGVNASEIDNLAIFAAKLPDNGTMTVSVDVTASAQLAEITYTGSATGGTTTTLEVGGNIGVEQLSFAASTATSAVAFAVNQLTDSTGVSAVVSGGTLRFTSTDYGDDKYVSVEVASGTFATSASKDFGVDAQVNINGAIADVEGLVASIRNEGLDLTMKLDAAFAQNTATGTTSFTVTGGGAKFQLGQEVTRQGQIHVGIQSVSTTRLGDDVIGYLSSMGSGGENSLVSGNTTKGQQIITESIMQVARMRGRLGALQKNTLETNISTLSVALENVTASESAIRDADFAKETAAMTRSQILVQANTSVLAQANSIPQNVLSLLQ